MDTTSFDILVDRELRICKDKLKSKAKEYATVDRLHNFKVAAALEECTVREALRGMMAKHTVSVYDMCKSEEELPIALWDEKITDHINYLLLLRAVVEEDSRELQGL